MKATDLRNLVQWRFFPKFALLALSVAWPTFSASCDDFNSVPSTISDSKIADDLARVLANPPVEEYRPGEGWRKVSVTGVVKWAGEAVFAPRGPIDWKLTRQAVAGDVLGANWKFQLASWDQEPLAAARLSIDRLLGSSVAHRFITGRGGERWNFTVAFASPLELSTGAVFDNPAAREVRSTESNILALRNSGTDRDDIPTDDHGNYLYSADCESLSVVSGNQIVAAGVLIRVPKLVGQEGTVTDAVLMPCLLTSLGIAVEQLPVYLKGEETALLRLASNPLVKAGMREDELKPVLARLLTAVRHQPH